MSSTSSEPERSQALSEVVRIVPPETKRLTKKQEVELFELLEADRIRFAVEQIQSHEQIRAKEWFQQELLTCAEHQLGWKVEPLPGSLVRINRVYQLMVELNQGLVHSCVRNYKVREELYPDLFQEGCLGIYRAVDLFEVKRGFRFSTYAMQWIRSKVGRGLELDGLRNTAPILGSETTKTFNRKGLTRARIASLDTPLAGEPDSNLHDLVSDTAFIDQSTLQTQEEIKRLVRRTAEKVISGSKDPVRVRSIVEGRLLSDSPLSLVELGDAHGISRERVRQIELEVKRAFKKHFTKMRLSL